jgi:CRISPR/Cas system-associated exonuclease Cas4 (RecB family)
MTVVSIAAAVSSKILADEFRPWRPYLTKRIIALAVRRLPQEQCERYREEWLSYVEEVPGEIGRLLAALGMLWAGVKLGSVFRKESKIAAVASSSISEERAFIELLLKVTSEDVLKTIEGSKGLQVMYRNARVMLEIADSAARRSNTGDRLLLDTLRDDAMHIRVCALMALCQCCLKSTSEDARVNAFRAAQWYTRMAEKVTRLRSANGDRAAPL